MMMMRMRAATVARVAARAASRGAGAVGARAAGVVRGVVPLMAAESPAVFTTCVLRAAPLAVQSRHKQFWNGGRHIYPQVDLSQCEPYKPAQLQSWVRRLSDGDRVGLVNLNDDVFGQQLRADIVHRVVHWQLAKKRRGTASAKERNEVRGGGRKPWAQKGSGRARAGSIRSPLWRGGGKAHGPRPRSYDYSLPKKVRHLGLKVALSAKYAEGNLIVLQDAELQSHKTAALRQSLRDGFGLTGDRRVLLIDAMDPLNDNTVLAARNIPWFDVLPVRGANVYDIVRHHTLMITTEALPVLEQRFAGLLNLMHEVDAAWEMDDDGVDDMDVAEDDFVGQDEEGDLADAERVADGEQDSSQLQKS